jgi:hypothetical protein
MRKIVKGVLAAAMVSGLGVLGAGCLTRPVTHQEPTTKTNFTAVVKQQAVDKIDLLFMIDNSASMGDKQDYLKLAIPDLIKRLVQPNCVDQADPNKVVGISDIDPAKSCSAFPNSKVEFPPVHNMHIGVVTSALGPRGGDVCPPGEKTTGGLLNAHNDDGAHLINRGGDDEHAIASMQPSNFLSWFPTVPANAGKDPGKGAVPQTDLGKFEADFADLISGTHQLGCGIESQLESWYRFLVQPDPYDKVLDNSGTWDGIDHTILQQRHDFLRPDSLVAIVALSDENDSEIDVRSLGKQAYLWMSSGFKPPRGNSKCAGTPNDPACTSCKLMPNNGAGDSECDKGDFSAQNDWGFFMNLRHVHMKQKYGIDLQFPISRYVTGLTSPSVPNRDGEYPAGKANYVGDAKCMNPLFAKGLPDGSENDANKLCNLQRGPRTKDLIFYAHIGGVPSRLLHFKPNDPAASTLTDADWTSILGKDTEHYDYSGIDPHMIEDFAPRPGLPPPSSADNADPDNGREWVTNAGQGVDRQFACTFALPGAGRDCTQAANQQICDCPTAPGTPHDQVPPLCDASTTRQIRAKAYPTIREILLARKLGTQGILSSICPIHVTEQGANDPLYGYRPAVSAIVDRLKNALASQCLPEPLVTDPATGLAPCLILAVLADSSSKCVASQGLKDPDQAILQKFRENLKAASAGDGGVDDVSTHTICEVQQLTGADLVGNPPSCSASTKPGWCYVTGAAAGGSCSQAVLFSANTPPTGAQVSLQCIEQQAPAGASDAGGGG